VYIHVYTVGRNEISFGRDTCVASDNVIFDRGSFSLRIGNLSQICMHAVAANQIMIVYMPIVALPYVCSCTEIQKYHGHSAYKDTYMR